jgi:hypothetical protein
LDGESVHYLESFGSVYLFRRIENDLHCGDTSVLDRLQGFLNLFHTNAIVKNPGQSEGSAEGADG